MTEARCHLVFGGGKVAGTPAIAAPGTSYAIAFAQFMKNAELLPPSAADCAADMIDENEEDTSRRLRRQPVHRNGATPLRLLVGEASGSNRGSIIRQIKTLEERIRLRRQHSRAVGTWKTGTIFYTDCAEQVELLAHEYLAVHLDRAAPFEEVFSCSMDEGIKAVERALSQLGLPQSARREDRARIRPPEAAPGDRS